MSPVEDLIRRINAELESKGYEDEVYVGYAVWNWGMGEPETLDEGGCLEKLEAILWECENLPEQKDQLESE